MTKVGRPKNEFDIEEVNEIIEKKLKDVAGDLSKLSYYSVSQFNKQLVKKKAKNYKGEIYTDYGTYFWNGNYKGKQSLGKDRIDFYKQHKEIVPMGELYNIDTTDIELIFDNNKDDIQVIKRRILKVFKKERSQNANNEEMFLQMQKDVQKYMNLVEQYKEALFMLFYNSQYSTNSLDDVLSLKKAGNQIMVNELNAIFDSDISLNKLLHLKNENLSADLDDVKNEIDKNIIQMATLFKK